MKIRILSDCHIGDKSSADDFILNEIKFILFLKRCVVENNLVILAGDTFECWQGKKFSKDVNTFYSIAHIRPMLMDALHALISGGKLKIINGNHDAIIRMRKLIPEVSERQVIKDGNVTLVVEHGHYGDFFNSNVSWIGKTIAWIAGWLERFGLADIDRVWGWFEKQFTRGIELDKTSVYKYAMKLAKRFNANIVVFGHTHKEELRYDKNGVVYANSGCVCEKNNKFPVVDIEIKDNKYNVQVIKVTV